MFSTHLRLLLQLVPLPIEDEDVVIGGGGVLIRSVSVDGGIGGSSAPAASLSYGLMRGHHEPRALDMPYDRGPVDDDDDEFGGIEEDALKLALPDDDDEAEEAEETEERGK